jgi:hypothetical protein
MNSIHSSEFSCSRAPLRVTRGRRIRCQRYYADAVVRNKDRYRISVHFCSRLAPRSGLEPRTRTNSHQEWPLRVVSRNWDSDTAQEFVGTGPDKLLNIPINIVKPACRRHLLVRPDYMTQKPWQSWSMRASAPYPSWVRRPHPPPAARTASRRRSSTSATRA